MQGREKLVKALVTLHGGSVRAISDGLDCGTEVTSELPVSSGVSAPEKEPVHEARACRVLVIEDNEDAAQMTKMLLELRGHEVRVALTGADGLVQARASLPDVIFCDIGLPGDLDGYEVARTLRADPRFARVRLVAMTGYGQEEDKRWADEAGFSGHLTKPVDPEAMLAIAGRWE